MQTKLQNNSVPPITKPPFLIASYRTIPLKILDIPPIPKWKNPYAHVKAKVDSKR